MKIVYHDADDVLHVQLSDDPIVRDESHGWHLSLGFSTVGLAEIVVLNLRELLVAWRQEHLLERDDVLPELDAGGTKSGLYDKDFYQWIEAQAQLLRAGRLLELDAENLLEEVEALGRAEKRGLRSQLEQIICHLLALSLSAYSDEDIRRGKDAVIRLRTEFARDIADSPCLQHIVPELFAQAWSTAAASMCRTVRVPTECPFSLEQILDDDFWPLPTTRGKPNSIVDLAGSVKSPVSGVSIEDMRAGRDRHPPVRIGTAKGRFDVPDDFETVAADEIAELFAGTSVGTLDDEHALALFQAFRAAMRVTGAVGKSVALLREPVNAFDGRSLERLVVEGRVSDVLEYLGSITSGIDFKASR